MSTQGEVAEKVKIHVTPPKKWAVIFLNDDVTPMELVIDILRKIFKHDFPSAEKITMDIHNTGSGVAGVYSHEIAEELSLSATKIARQNGSPLKVQMEEA